MLRKLRHVTCCTIWGALCALLAAWALPQVTSPQEWWGDEEAALCGSGNDCDDYLYQNWSSRPARAATTSTAAGRLVRLWNGWKMVVTRSVAFRVIRRPRRRLRFFEPSWSRCPPSHLIPMRRWGLRRTAPSRCTSKGPVGRRWMPTRSLAAGSPSPISHAALVEGTAKLVAKRSTSSW